MPRLSSVSEYIAAQPPPVQGHLKRVRAILRKALPGAEEVISYQMPAYKLPGGVAVFFAGWKTHYALYPGGSRLSPKLVAQLARYKVSKGTIRFPLDQPVPEKLIENIAKFRAEQIARSHRAR